MVQGVLARKRFLVRFQNGREKNLSLNQLTNAILEKIPVEKEPEVSGIAEILEEKFESEKGYYHCVYVMLWFKKEVGVDIMEDQADVEDDPDKEEMDDFNIDDERERHWRMVFKENDGGVEDEKALLHDKRWDVYVNEKENIVKGGYLVEVVSHEKNKVLWGVVDDHVVEEPTDNEEIGLRGFDFNFFDEDEEGGCWRRVQ